MRAAVDIPPKTDRMGAPGAATMGRTPMWARITPFLVYVGILALTPALTDTAGRLGVPSLWLQTLNGVIAGLLLILFWRHYHELREGPRLTLSHMAWSVAAGALVFVFWIKLDAPWMVWGAAPQFDPTGGERGFGNLASTAFRLASLIVVVPLMEELFWRSFLMRWITDHNFSRVDPRHVSLFAFAATAVLFAVEHHLWLAGLVAGITFNLLYMWTRNLHAPVAAHAVANACLGIFILAYSRWDLW